MERGRPAVVSRAQQANPRPSRGSATGDVQRVRPRLRGDDYYQTGASVELLSQVDDRPRLTGTGW